MVKLKTNLDPYFVVDMQWDSLPKNTFDSLGFHDCFCTSLGVDGSNININVDVYPNPVINGEFTVKAEDPIERVEIINVSGKLVKLKVFDGQVREARMSMNKDQNGLYLIKVTLSSGQIQTKKLLFR